MKQLMKDTAILGIALWLIGYLASLVLFFSPFAGVIWVLIAIVLDYLFIVLLFQANYYGPDVFVYYALTFLIPVGVGLFLNRNRNAPTEKQL